MEKTKTKKIKRILIISVVVLVVLFCTASMIMVKLMFNDSFGRGEIDNYSASYRYNDIKDVYQRTPVEFYSGENLLKGYIYGADNDKALLVIAHGIGGGHEGYISEIIRFVDNGYRVFAYDCTGSCESEGDGTIGLSQSALDLDAALTYIENDSELSKLKKVLLGHSWGGYAVCAVQNFDHDIAAAASISGYSEPVEMITEWGERSLGAFVYAEYPFIWLNNKIIFGQYSDLSAVEGINKSDIPTLIIHGTGDDVINYEGASIISKKDKITNPNVEYYTVTDKEINGHNSIFYSIEAQKYQDELEDEYDELCDEYGENIPDEVNEKFYAEVDKAKANEHNEAMFEKIEEFFDYAISG